MTMFVEIGRRGARDPADLIHGPTDGPAKWFADAGASGAEQEALDSAFQFQQGRFREKIQLGDDNLAESRARAAAQKPKDEAAQKILDEAFANLTRHRPRPVGGVAGQPQHRRSASRRLRT